MAKYNCPTCNAPCESESGCWKHKQKKPLSKGKKLSAKPKREEQKQENREALEKQWELFLNIWNTRPHKSEVSKEPIYGEPLSIYFHHIIPKRESKELKYEPENIIILTFEEHQKVEQDMYFYPEVNKRREILKEKFLN